jgi:elongation factor P
MDTETYDQINFAADDIENRDLLAPNAEVQVLIIRDQPFRVDLPIAVELAVVRTDPGAKGDTVSNVTKPAELETGAIVNVPLFVNEGDRLRIDTRTRQYVSRV